jgi:hypothetical protein
MMEFAICDCAALAEIKHITPQSTHSTTVWTLAWQTRAAVGMLRGELPRLRGHGG